MAFWQTVANPITDCVTAAGAQGKVTSKLLTLPQGGYDTFASKENDDHNPDRVKPRKRHQPRHRNGQTCFILKAKRRYTASLDIANLTNVVAVL